MKYPLLLLFLFPFPLFSCSGIYTSCVSKVKDAHVIQGNTLFVPISTSLHLVYSRTKPKGKILKFDPFLSLYLIEKKHTFAYPFTMSMPKKLKTSLITQQKACSGKFIYHQVGLNHLGSYSVSHSRPALITNSCCVLEALATQNGVIEKPYLQHFLKAKGNLYGDIGIRVSEEKKGITVIARDPYYKNNPFYKGDIILSYDGQKVYSASNFMQKVLFSRLGSWHNVKVQRGAHVLKYHVQIRKRYGGGMISDTFLEREGVYFDNSLHFIKVSKRFKNYGLSTGDKLLAVNGHRVTTQEELRSYLADFHNYSQLLIERNKFQFFVNIK